MLSGRSVLTFDGNTVDYYNSGEFWVVWSETIGIQVRQLPDHASNGFPVIKEIAIGGSSWQGHRLIVANDWTTWDGNQILTAFPSTFQTDLVQATYTSAGPLLEAKYAGKFLHVVHLSLPDGVTVQVNRWREEALAGNRIDVQVTMSPQPHQDGHCGNFNGHPGDDAKAWVRARMGGFGVLMSELLFFGPKTPISRDMDDCPEHKARSAMEKCKKKTRASPSLECLFNMCFNVTGGSRRLLTTDIVLV